jgi:hypothetical protein
LREHQRATSTARFAFEVAFFARNGRRAPAIVALEVSATQRLATFDKSPHRPCIRSAKPKK